MTSSTEEPVCKAPSGAHLFSSETIQAALEHAAELLPSQGPITAFVHHNTLHALEDMNFDAAVRAGAACFGCHPYLPETDYRNHVLSGRIRSEDIDAVLIDWLGDRADTMLGFLGTRFGLYRAILNHDLHDGPTVNVRWVVGDTNALTTFRDDADPGVRERFLAITRRWVMQNRRSWMEDSAPGHSGVVLAEVDRNLVSRTRRLLQRFDATQIESWPEAKWEAFSLHLLWQICEAGIASAIPQSEIAEANRHRDWIRRCGGPDPDGMADEVLIRFCAAYLDQGMSDWPLDNPESGFYATFLRVYGQKGWLKAPWKRRLARQIDRRRRTAMTPSESIADSLAAFGVAGGSLQEFVNATLLALRGFAGMIWHLETRGDRVTRGMPPGTLLEYLAVRLLLDQAAAEQCLLETKDYSGPLSEFVTWARQQTLSQSVTRETICRRRCFQVFELAQLLGWNPDTLAKLGATGWKKLIHELDGFTSIDRRAVYHRAYERRYRNATLDAVRVHAGRVREQERTDTDRSVDFQIVCCIDEREESFRRHLEEVHPHCETLGAAGFFAVPMYYRGAADAHYTPLCPVTIKPRHHVREEVVYSLRDDDRRRRRARRTIGTVTHRVHIGSRTFTGGWLGTTLLGSLATIPLVLRTLFPRSTAQLKEAIGGFVKPPEITRLVLERDPNFPPGAGDGQLGFTVTEMADIVERLLGDLGVSEFSRLFLVCGHGSASLNNPHEAAHDCGACAGGRGGPNARAFAQMANNKQVRQRVAERGLEIPDTTLFVGCYHNTCDDSVTYYDLDQIPFSHRRDFEIASAAVDEARKRDAHERCRRFESTPLDLSFEAALRHVEGRAEDLSQVRPEYGHATNALCFVGRREWSRGLFLDRRAFLQSYDPTRDDDRFSILERILQAVIPVCAGINLEYYFSFVDPVGYGCGTKLPHNITSLVGVMNGAGSDLRPGLPWQMVEIHEPVRLLFVIEAPARAMNRIIADNPGIQKLCAGEWVQLALLDPQSGIVQLYREGQFHPHPSETDELASADSSPDWYRGWRDHLGFASIGGKPGGSKPAVASAGVHNGS